VNPGSALIIGLIGGVACFLAVQAKQVLKYDDSLDVVGVHGAGGLLGALLVGWFAIRPMVDGASVGGASQVMLQLQGVLATGIYAFVLTLILGLLIHKTIGFTVDETTEEEGLDLKEHGEAAYRLV
jgi:Amt family ammonium transporter